MKHKLYLMVSLILVAFVAITSYTPLTAHAEQMMQAEPVSEVEQVSYTEAVEDTSKQDASQINSNLFGYYSAFGNNFTAHNSEVTYYDGNLGCLGSDYDGNISKTFSVTLNMPKDVKGYRLNLTYFNTVDQTTSNGILVSLVGRNYGDFGTQVIKNIVLSNPERGLHLETFDLENVTFDTGERMYWLDFTLPKGEGIRQFCGAQLVYYNPPLFPVAMPMINK